jgi:hypothetical protein
MNKLMGIKSQADKFHSKLTQQEIELENKRLMKKNVTKRYDQNVSDHENQSIQSHDALPSDMTEGVHNMQRRREQQNNQCKKTSSSSSLDDGQDRGDDESNESVERLQQALHNSIGHMSSSRRPSPMPRTNSNAYLTVDSLAINPITRSSDFLKALSPKPHDCEEVRLSYLSTSGISTMALMARNIMIINDNILALKPTAHQHIVTNAPVLVHRLYPLN